jgi:hypothetical protein
MSQIMLPLLADFAIRCPSVFGDLHKIAMEKGLYDE